MPTYLSPGVYVEEIAFEPGSIEGVRTSTAQLVDEAIDRSPAFADHLARETQRRIAADMTRVVTAIMTSSPAADREPGAADLLIQTVDFPGFVANLVEGVFNAVVDARDLLTHLLSAGVAATSSSGRGR